MRHLVFQEPGRVAFEEAEDPPLADDAAAIVRPLAIARCDLDPIMAALGVFPGPFPVGHEAVAEVVEVGPAVAGHRPGKRVVVPFQVSCGACDACRTRRFAACRTHRAKAGAAFGFGPVGGGHGGAVAERLLVPHADHLLEPAPDGLSPEQLCTLPDNVVDAYRTVGPPLAAWSGAEVLVIGGAAPSIGLYAVALARALGSPRVRYIDGDPGRLGQAERLGARVVEHAGDWPRRFERAPITVKNTGSPEGLACTIRSTDDYGICTPVAIHFAPMTPVPRRARTRRDRGSRHRAPAAQRWVELACARNQRRAARRRRPLAPARTSAARVQRLRHGRRARRRGHAPRRPPHLAPGRRSELQAHVLTHGHLDHTGASHEICRARELPLLCGEGDVATVESGGRVGLAGKPWPVRLEHRLLAGPGHPVAVTLREGDQVAGFTVLEAPGHSPGHLAFWRAHDRVLVLGDALVNATLIAGRPGLRPPPALLTPDPAQNLTSARRLAALDPAVICFGQRPAAARRRAGTPPPRHRGRGPPPKRGAASHVNAGP